MTATTEPVPGSRQPQQFLRAVGEVRLRRFDADGAADGVDHPVEQRTSVPDTVPPDVEYSDFYTEWQPAGPS